MSSRLSQISVVIVDDDPQSISSIQEMMKQDSRFSVLATFTDPEAALKNMITMKPDLLILDINMQGMNGFALVRELNDLNIHPFLIFVTGHDEFAIQAIKISAFDYLLKPIEPVDFAKAMERFINSYSQNSLNKNYIEFLSNVSIKRLKLNTAGGFIMINPNDIIFIEADWNYSKIFLSGDKYELVSMNLGMVDTLLPAKKFARINRSVIINLQYLDKVLRGKRQCILKKNNEIFSFSIPLNRIRELEELI